MEGKIRDSMIYLAERYPHKHELSNARLTKMIYLADWVSCLRHGKQITDIEWVFNYYGPYVDEIKKIAENDKAFEIEHTENAYGQPKELMKLVSANIGNSLSTEDKSALDFVIDKCRSLFWNGFIQLIYSTYPILTQKRFTKLNLVHLAEKYNSMKADETEAGSAISS